MPDNTSNFDTKKEINVDHLLNKSKLSQVNNADGTESGYDNSTATSGQKWWAAIILGFIFAIISSLFFYTITNAIFTSLGGLPTAYGGPTLIGLILHTVIFILIVRLILW